MKPLIINYLVLITINLAMVYSSTYKLLLADGRLPVKEALETVIFLIVFFIMTVIIMSNKYFFKRFVDKNIKIIFIFVLILCGLVLTPLGIELGGAKSSLKIGPINFQPIELLKVIMIFYLAKTLSKTTDITEKDSIIKIFILPFIGIGFILLEPDLGGVVILSLLFITMLIINGKDLDVILKVIAILSGLGIAILVILFKIFPNLAYQIERIGAWINPFDYLAGAGGNLIQSYIAISNGGFFGQGYLNSTQNTGYLFASSSDFIFSIIIEEFGIFGGVVVLSALVIFAVQIYLVGYRSGKKYEYLICSGFAALILIQTMVNVGGVTGVIPMTGVTLPFISKGINSLFFLSIAVVYVLIIHKENMRDKNAKKKRSVHTYTFL